MPPGLTDVTAQRACVSALRAAGGTEGLQLGTRCVAAPGEMGLCG